MAKEGVQLELFQLQEPGADADWQMRLAADRALIARVPSHVAFGTSSWTFPGWAGIVYPGRPSEQELARDGLRWYAQHPLFRTVGIDRSFYRPLDSATLGQYAAALPAGFRCVLKVWQDVTRPLDPKTGRVSSAFLNPQLFESEILRPLAAHFADHVGSLLLEFPPVRGQLGARSFARDLGAFLARVSKEFRYCVEIRDAKLLTREYLDTLAEHRTSHVLNFWERMPEIGRQLEAPGILTTDFVVARLLIPPGRRYQERRAQIAPFDRIVEAETGMREDIVRLARACESLGKVLLVLVNNKAEGSSPLTVRALAERLAAEWNG